MRVRICFSKLGSMKYIGHLDVMRFFQKAIRRAELPAAYSGGFSPHMIMSFASPLGVGITSDSEYFDLDMVEAVPSEEMIARLNLQMPEGIQIHEIREIPEDKHSKGMTLVAAAIYRISSEQEISKAMIDTYLAQTEILIEKKTKKGFKQMDIRPLIYELYLEDAHSFSVFLAQGSMKNLNPRVFMDQFISFFGMHDMNYQIHRKEIFTESGKEGERCFIPLRALGKRIEA